MKRRTIWCAVLAVLVTASATFGQQPVPLYECPTGGCPTGTLWERFVDPNGRGNFDPVDVQAEASCQIADGTGTLIGRGDDWGVIWTCAHGDLPEVTQAVFPVTRETVKATLLVADKARDVALYLTGRMIARAVKVAAKLPKVGATIIYGGFGPNKKWQAFRGRFRGRIQTRRTDRGPMVGGVEWQGSSRPGDSGGAAWTKDGVFSLVTGTGNGNTVGPDGIYVCQMLDSLVGEDRFVLPWNAHTAEERSRNESEVAREQERTRQAQQAILPGTVDAQARAATAANATNIEQLKALEPRVASLEADGTETQAVLERLGLLSQNAADAAKAAETLNGKVAEAQATAEKANAAVDEVDASLADRIKSGVVGFIKTLVKSYWGWGSLAAVGLAYGGWWLIKRTVLKKYVMPLAQVIDRITDLLPGKFDDILIDGRAYGIAEKLSGQKRPAHWNEPGVDPWGRPYNPPASPPPAPPANPPARPPPANPPPAPQADPQA